MCAPYFVAARYTFNLFVCRANAPGDDNNDDEDDSGGGNGRDDTGSVWN